jgi:hypothetical protein
MSSAVTNSHNNRGFASLSTEFETLMQQLTLSDDPAVRKRILGQLRDVIGRIDFLITKEPTRPNDRV